MNLWPLVKVWQLCCFNCLPWSEEARWKCDLRLGYQVSADIRACSCDRIIQVGTKEVGTRLHVLRDRLSGRPSACLGGQDSVLGRTRDAAARLTASHSLLSNGTFCQDAKLTTQLHPVSTFTSTPPHALCLAPGVATSDQSGCSVANRNRWEYSV
jgi:hypothetical protein